MSMNDNSIYKQKKKKNITKMNENKTLNKKSNSV